MDSVVRVVPRQQRSTASIEALVDAAERVIDRVGSSGLTTALVAAEAGVSVGRVYYWFEDASALVRAVAERAAGRVAARLADVGEGARTVTVELALRRVVEELVAAVWLHPGVVSLLVSGRGGAGAPDGGVLRDALVGSIDAVVVGRVRGLAEVRRPAVSVVVVESLVAVVAAALTAEPALGMRLEHEVVEALSAYLGSARIDGVRQEV
jgi:AcrR family transcriptional regulator